MSYRRKIKLIQHGLQLKLIWAFVCLSAVGLQLQYLLLLRELTRTASELPHDGMLLQDGIGGMLGRILAISALVILPLTVFVGIVATHRFAGPVYRLKAYLRQVIDGESPPDCKLRKGDELQDLCALINEATAPVRAQEKPLEERDAKKPGLRAVS